MAGRRQSFDFLGGGGGLHQSPEREQNQNPTPVACRLCGEVFMDNWVLIDHVGVHMGLDEASSRMRSERNRLSYPRDVTLLNPNPPCYYLVSSRPGLQAQQGGHLVPTAGQEMNHSVGGINPIGALPAASAPRGVLPVDSGNSHQLSLMLAPSPPPQAQLAPKDLPGDRTRPFLDQLERRLTLEMKCRNDQKNVIKAEPSSAALDLTLKL